MSTPIENNTEELQTILQTVNNLPNLGGSGSSDVFVVHVTLDENWENVTSVDKTYEEIVEAITSRKLCFVELRGNALSFLYYEPEHGGKIAFSDHKAGYTMSVYLHPDEPPAFRVESDYPYVVELGGIPDNGSVVSGSVSNLAAFYNSVEGNGMIRLGFTLVNSETSVPIAYYYPTVNLVFFETPTSAGYFARAFVKEGYIDVSFTEVNSEFQYEAFFKRMT